MPYCLNPACPQPDRPGEGEACHYCHTPLALKNRYVALNVIGQGGFGKTLLAEDQDKPRKPRCVIKVFAPQGQGDLAGFLSAPSTRFPVSVTYFSLD